MPLPLLVSVTPVGSVPDSVIAAVGLPVVVTVNVPGRPGERSRIAARDGRGLLHGDRQRLLGRAVAVVAARCMAYVPAVAGVPDRLAVPSALAVNVMPGGTLSQPKLGAG